MKNRIIYLLFLFTFCFIIKHQIQAQNNKIDSLKIIAQSKTNDTVKVNALNQLAFELRNSNPDKAKNYAEEANELAINLKYQKGIAESYGYIGLIYYRYSQYDLALSYYFKSIKISEDNKFEQLISFRYNDIANIFIQQNQAEKAIRYFEKSIKIKQRINDLEGIATSYNNIATAYNQLKQYFTAIEFIKKAANIAEEKKLMRVLAVSFENLGEAYFNLHNYDLALLFFTRASQIRKEIKNTFGYTKSLNSIAKTHFELGNYTNAISYYYQALDSSKKFNLRREMQIAYIGLSQTYKKSGDIKNALIYHEFFSDLKDSIFSEAVNEKLAQKQVRYDFEKKRTQIETLSKEKEEQSRLIQIFIIGFLILITLLSFLIYNIIQRRKANLLLQAQKRELIDKNEEIKQQNEEILTQRDEIEASALALQKSYTIIKEKNERITDSIYYAKRIQNAMLIADEILSTYLSDYFILYKPKDIVSGDFYWAKKIDNRVLVTVADCTGHGVPGAFMSMLGISLLNEIVVEHENKKANEILNQLRIHLKKSLSQTGKRDETKDGMDLAFCIIDFDTKQMQYAGANNPLWIIRKTDTNSKSELIELKADRMPIGIHLKETDFENREIQLIKNDCIYIFSDGFQDQLGGPDDRKFLVKNFRELIISINNLSLQEQKEILNKTIEDYHGTKYEQVDDILVMGIKIAD